MNLLFCLNLFFRHVDPIQIFFQSVRRSVGVKSATDHTAIELIRCHSPGLLSELSVVLTRVKYNVVSAGVWTHNTQAAAVVQVTMKKHEVQLLLLRGYR